MSNIVKGSGIIYTTGKPNTIPNTGSDAEFAISTDGNQWAWNRTTNVWDNLGYGIEVATSSLAPTHTPTDFRPRFVVTPARKFYFYSGSWGQISGGYHVWSANLAQARNGTAINIQVIENTNNVSIEISYSDVGVYQIVSSTSIFTSQANVLFSLGTGNTNVFSYKISRIDEFKFELHTFDITGTPANLQNSNSYIEIKYYA
jgi:hypothetical protein